MGGSSMSIDKCLYCGADINSKLINGTSYQCGSWKTHILNGSDKRSYLCIEREARQKAESELASYKRELAEIVKACEPLRNIRGLTIGENITTKGVRLMISENNKLREIATWFSSHFVEECGEQNHEKQEMFHDPATCPVIEKGKKLREELNQITKK
jgi:hypothetical protein